MMDLFQLELPKSSSAIISDCGRYRYELWRRWKEGGYAMFIGLNPSTADETKDDPTIRKCIGFAKQWGYGALCMTNLFAFRATDPRDMKRELYPTGEHNLDHLLKCAKGAGIVIAAWGTHGSHQGRDKSTAEVLCGTTLHALRLNSDGSPGHPLYIPYSAKPFEWTP